MIKDGIFQFSEIKIIPNMNSTNIDNKDIFNKVELDNTTFYLTKVKQRLGNMSFWIRLMVINGIVKKIELRNADEKYKMNYSNMTNELLEEKYQSHNIFLAEHIGKPNNESLGGKEYLFNWGSIYSFKDIKTGDCGIVVEYRKGDGMK